MSDTPTTRNIYEPAMHVRDQAQADKLFEALVHECIEVSGKSRDECERIQRSNLGYLAGNFSHETRARVERLFQCEHPCLGAIAQTGPLTPQQVFDIGVKRGHAWRRASEGDSDV